jgi:hypothetical protein
MTTHLGNAHDITQIFLMQVSPVRVGGWAGQRSTKEGDDVAPQIRVNLWEGHARPMHAVEVRSCVCWEAKNVKKMGGSIQYTSGGSRRVKLFT